MVIKRKENGAEKRLFNFTARPDEMQRLRIASAFAGVSMSEFCRQAIEEKAEKTLQEAGIANGR